MAADRLRVVRFGMSTVQSVSATLRRRVEDGTIPGGLVLVAVDGELVYLETVGQLDLAPERPVERDMVIWLASLTKPIIAVATLMLAEHGLLALEDELSRHLPEFAEPVQVRTWDAPPPMGLPGAPPPDEL